MKRSVELKPEELRSECDPSAFGFKTTDEISPRTAIIGQERALKSIDFGLNMNGEGFNLYVSGLPGSGRNTTIIKAVEELAGKKSVPDDLCYLYNFEKPEEPKALQLRAGMGCTFQKDMEEFIKDLESEIQKAFSSENYEKHKKAVIDEFEKKKEDLETELEEHAGSKGFVIQQTLTGVVVAPVYKGQPLTAQQYEKLSADEKERIKKDQAEVDEKLDGISRKVREFQRETKTSLSRLDKDVGLYSIGHLIDELKKKYKDYELITRHLDEVKDDILENLDLFKKEPESREFAFFPAMAAKDREGLLNKYKVNVLVDNCKTKGAPVITETNPTYYNLIGYAEYRAQFGVLNTDFTMIKPGSVLKANGGFLIIQAHRILRDYFAWDALKKVIEYKRVKIENIAEQYGLIPTTGLRPQPVPVDLKVIIIGNPLIYQLLYIYDEDFRKLFKVKVDFDTASKKSDEFIIQYAYSIAQKAKEEKLLPFKAQAVAKIIDYGSRLISHKEKLSTRFLEIVDIMRQADYWARRENAKHVDAVHVKEAIEEKVYRSNMIEEKIWELFAEKTLFLDTDGEETGQINGIAVLELGDYMFGKPSRITARTYLGKGNIINIEREAKMSGKIHSKGVLILSAYLGNKFAQDKPLALSASICFEQLYEEVEGDSASSAELYCLLSSLSDAPLRQDIAVTGSVNQRGEVQPIGGVNEKIEGFYEVCKIKGLTGRQGVMIPRANVKHLMLKEEVVEASVKGKFHIYAVETIEEGIEILTGKDAGKIFSDANKKLGSYAKVAAEQVADKDSKNK